MAVLYSLIGEVEEELGRIPVVLRCGWLEREPGERGKVIGETFRASEAEWIPTWVADIGELEGGAIAGAK
jgi:hypothetical protein